MDIIKTVEEEKIIVIMRGLSKEDALKTAEAMIKGGIKMIEVTFEMEGNPDETGKIIKKMSEQFEGRLLVGAGTVLTEEQLLTAKNSGAKYIITPNTNVELIKKTKELGLIAMPGALTPSEIYDAYKAGADFVKIFPVAALGESYVKDVLAPLSKIKLLGVGGINYDNMEKYFKLGIKGIGISSGIINKQLIKEGRFDEIEELSRKFVNKLKEF